jgi:hypothetical protein
MVYCNVASLKNAELNIGSLTPSNCFRILFYSKTVYNGTLELKVYAKFVNTTQGVVLTWKCVT